MAGSREIVEQAIGGKVICEIDLGKQISIEISRANRQSPRCGYFVSEYSFYLLELGCGIERGTPGRPAQYLGATSVIGPGHRILHMLLAAGAGIKDSGVVCKEVAEYQVQMAISVQVRLGGAVREPALGARHQLIGDVEVATQPDALARPGVRSSQEHYRGPSPIVDKDVGQPI